MAVAMLTPRRLLGMAAPMSVWALHFVAVYALQGLACAEHWQRRRVAGVEAVTWWLLGLTLLALAAIAALGLRAWRLWRHAEADAERASARRDRFMAALTALLALLAAIAVVFTALPILLLPPCA